jgi:uncharacterized protein
MKVAVTGATGFVGTQLCALLQEKKHTVVALTRDAAKAPRGTEAKPWDGKDVEALKAATAGCDAIVNLAGENIFAKKWDAEFKKTIRASRIDCTRACVEACKAGPKVLVNASATGYYGPRGPEVCDEESMADQWNFLSSVCLEWEAEAKKAESAGVRVVLLRIGVVLGRNGGAIQKMLPPFRAGFGGPIGKGDQFLSWVHIDDVCGLAIRAIEDAAWKGPFNATAPTPVTNKEFSKTLAKILHRPSVFVTPPFVMKLMLGEVAELVTKGQNVLPKKALAAGYEFRFPTVEGALRNLLDSPEAKSA